ncbi:SNF-related serine/threonine-protein kinase [Chelonia mydas]|uniref:SNF-related serine/threonine-protein kinase n=1 Tax=Chelonia mydas TaxID=8469 RepID=M7AV47_CHEMY|nr:SNF-related serine/threonine-protein kinase [Chelonia mydas]
MAGAKGCYEGKIAGLYDLERTLGKGHFAVVKLARHVFTGEKVAVKVIDKSKLDVSAAGQLLQEVRCMKLVQHPNVVRLYEVIDTHSKLYLILELGDGGDMFDHIMRHEGGLAEGRAKHYFAQIVHAISYCHKLHVVHRDLKPENVVFFREQGVVKLTDFGFSNRFQPGKMLTTSCGSLAYSAPEILLGDEYDAPAVDVWSLGVILYMLVCGQPPFQEANDSETLTMIMDCRYTIPPHVSAQCSEYAAPVPSPPGLSGAPGAQPDGLIGRMLQRDPKQRASLEQIEVHPWLQGVDPSPASRCLLPLTSHKRVSEEEHDIIIQAMTCGNIADRDAIQEALEADRYNHITATYFLLAERILREKQEKQSHKLSLVYNLAQQVQDSANLSDPFSTMGDTRDLSPFAEMPDRLAAFSSPQPRAEVEVSEKRVGKPLSFSALGEDDASPGLHGNGQLVRALLSPALADASIAKSTPALQQICEEEEEEEEEEGKANAMGRRSSSLNQEQMRDFQSSKVSLLFCRGPVAHSKGEKSLGATKSGLLEQGPGSSWQLPPLRGVPSPRSEPGQPREAPSHNAARAATDKLSVSIGESAPSPLPGGMPGAAGDIELREGGGAGLERCQAEGSLGSEEDTTTTTEMEDDGSLGQAGKVLTAGSEPAADNVIKVDPAKNKSAHLKDRLLQFPLCEKALAFKIRPSSKESLLALGQFNCCHVI